MDECKPIKTPVATNGHLDLDVDGKPVDQSLYRSMQAKGDISLQGVRSEEQLADIFTKPLDESTFVRLRNELNVLDTANVM